MTLPSANVDDWVVLLVDDHPDNVQVAVHTLTYHGAQVFSATNGQEALDMIESQALDPTLFLLDLQMPVMSGWLLFDRLKDDPRFADRPIIAITAHAMDGDEQKVLDYGFDGYISKPYDVITLVDRLKVIVDAKQ